MKQIQNPKINQIHQQRLSPYQGNKFQKQNSQPIQNNQLKNNAQINHQNSPRIIIRDIYFLFSYFKTVMLCSRFVII